jgi:hypothetical protein
MYQNDPRDCYATLLNNPFTAPPCRLGFGTMVPTQLGTATYRLTTSCNADGSLGVMVSPYLGQTTAPIAINNAGAGTNIWTGTNFQNIAQYPTSLLTELRVISLGLKVTPLVAATATPGICFAGQVAGYSQNQLTGLNLNYLASITSLESFVTNNHTVQASARPVDNAAYEFLIGAATGAGNNVYSMSTPVITFTGYPASSNMLIEIYMNFEFVPITTTTTSRSYDLNSSIDVDKISKHFVSEQSLWDWTVSRLNHAATIINYATSPENLLRSHYVGSVAARAYRTLQANRNNNRRLIE